MLRAFILVVHTLIGMPVFIYRRLSGEKEELTYK